MQKPTALICCFLLFGLSFAQTQETLPCHDIDIQSVKKPFHQEVGLMGRHLQDVTGEIHRLGQTGKPGAAVYVFMDTHCPISNRYVPYLNELHALAQTKNLHFYGVISSQEATWAQAENYRKEYKLNFPLFLDSNGLVARKLGPQITPEAFLLDARDQLVYRGRIDDRFPVVGKIRKAPKTHDLRDAMIATSEDRKPAVAHQPAVGCVFEAWSYEQTPTYHRNVAPIIAANCMTCHRDGGVAPFSLEGYQNVRAKARMSAFVAESGVMPPWKPIPGHGNFRDQRTLEKREINILKAWVEAGTPLGSEDNVPPTPSFKTESWPLGQPDLILQMSEAFHVPAGGEDIYRYFVLPSPIVTKKNVRAIDFKPGDSGVVHHANFFVDYYGKARTWDAQDAEPGFSVFGTGGFMEYDGAGAIGGWAPGADPYQLPEGLGMEIYPGDIVIEIHYHPNGRATSDQSSIAFYFSDEQPDAYVQGLFMGTQDVSIPANATDYKRHFWMDIPVGMTLIDIMPHMHYLGKEVNIYATLPDCRRVPLMRIEDWDLRWQNIYVYRHPIHLPAGSRIDAYYTFDNSGYNPANPNYPPKPVDWGWQSDEEMAEIYLTVIPDKEDELPHLLEASRRSWLRPATPGQSDEIPSLDLETALREMASLSPWSDASNELVAALYGQELFDAFLTELKNRAAANPTEVDTLSRYGIMLMIATEYAPINQQESLYTEAYTVLEKVLELAPQHWDAKLGMAILLGGTSDLPSQQMAESLFQELIGWLEQVPQRPEFALTYVHFGDFLATQGRSTEARTIWQQGLQAFPNHNELKQRLA